MRNNYFLEPSNFRFQDIPQFLKLLMNHPVTKGIIVQSSLKVSYARKRKKRNIQSSF